MSKMGKLGLIAALIFSTFVSISAPQVAHAATADTDQALKLSASTYDYAQTPSGNGIYPYVGSNPMTLEAWANSSDACNSSGAIVAGFETAYAIWCTSGYWYSSFYTSSWQNSQTNYAVVANSWTHLALTRDASGNWNFYINGTLQTSGTISPAGPQGSLFVGALPGRQYWNGQIDEVKYWNVARSQSQIRQDMKTFGSGGDSGLQLYYNFNDVVGSGPKTTANLGSMANEDLASYTSGGNPTYPDVKIIDTTTASGYTILKFPRTYINSNGGWKVPSSVSSISSVIVGGGGGGGMRAGGGGGAGGYVQDSNVAVVPNAIESITVGQGASLSLTNNQGLIGQDSIFGNHYTANGGGGGGGAGGGDDTMRAGSSGGSGGGASGHYNIAYQSAAVGTSTQISYPGNSFGNIGGTGVNSGQWPAGGGGGAGGAGGGGSGTSGGKGGLGKLDPILGLCLATGGGAGIYAGYTGGAGGDCGGTANPNGNSGTSGSTTPVPPLPNSGAGGGGAGWSSGSDVNGGAGASGVIIIKYKNYFGTSISLSVNPKKTTKSSASTPITATTTSTGTVTFYANGRVINGCNGVVVSGTTATCNWRPITQGQVTLTATYTSNDPVYSGSAAAPAYVTTVGKRTTAR
jgi:Concanavalin A-like lectin/glucanases superfamily